MILQRWILSLALVFVTFSLKAQTRLLDSIVNKDELKALVSYLSSDSMRGRYTGTIQADNAARYIASKFQKVGANPVAGNNGYYMETLNSLGNVMAVLPGKTLSEEIVIFSAHYDHIGTAINHMGLLFDREDADTIFNGANDNASGVSAILLLAHYFSLLGNNERTLMFIAFTGEELGLLGSYQLVTLLDSSKIKAVFNIDMIGGDIRPYITGDRYSNLRQIMNQTLFEADGKTYSKNYFASDRFPEQKLFNRSDNYPFALKGIPAHTIINTDPTDRNYHKPDDELSYINFERMAKAVRAIAIASRDIIAGLKTPNRIF